MEFLVRSSSDYRYRTMPAAEARAMLRGQLAQGRERHYKAWLQDLHHARQRLPNDRRLDHPAIASNVAILHDNGQPTLDVCRAYLQEFRGTRGLDERLGSGQPPCCAVAARSADYHRSTVGRSSRLISIFKRLCACAAASQSQRRTRLQVLSENLIRQPASRRYAYPDVVEKSHKLRDRRAGAVPHTPST